MTDAPSTAETPTRERVSNEVAWLTQARERLRAWEIIGAPPCDLSYLAAAIAERDSAMRECEQLRAALAALRAQADKPERKAVRDLGTAMTALADIEQHGNDNPMSGQPCALKAAAALDKLDPTRGRAMSQDDLTSEMAAAQRLYLSGYVRMEDQLAAERAKVERLEKVAEAAREFKEYDDALNGPGWDVVIDDYEDRVAKIAEALAALSPAALPEPTTTGAKS